MTAWTVAICHSDLLIYTAQKALWWPTWMHYFFLLSPLLQFKFFLITLNCIYLITLQCCDFIEGRDCFLRIYFSISVDGLGQKQAGAECLQKESMADSTGPLSPTSHSRDELGNPSPSSSTLSCGCLRFCSGLRSQSKLMETINLLSLHFEVVKLK